MVSDADRAVLCKARQHFDDQDEHGEYTYDVSAAKTIMLRHALSAAQKTSENGACAPFYRHASNDPADWGLSRGSNFLKLELKESEGALWTAFNTATGAGRTIIADGPSEVVYASSVDYDLLMLMASHSAQGCKSSPW